MFFTPVALRLLVIYCTHLLPAARTRVFFWSEVLPKSGFVVFGPVVTHKKHGYDFYPVKSR